MSTISAETSGVYMLGGDITVHCPGFGAMWIARAGICGEPADRGEAFRVLRRLPDLNINVIDTADSAR